MSKKSLKVIAGAPDRPLVIGDIEIPCYVLEDETRVLSQGGFLQSIGRSRTPRAGTGGGGDNTPSFLAAKNLKPFISNDLEKSTSPIPFQSKEGQKAFGYPATILPQVCEVYLTARDAGALLQSQMHIAQRAEILIRGLATVGIIALVDEATGYQRIREEKALATILEKYIAKELQPWNKTFPYEFYELIYKLKGWQGPDGHKRSPLIGRYTNEIVYARLAPGVLKELQMKNPILPTGSRQVRHHQWVTPELGHPRLREHLAAVMSLMRASPNWIKFQSNLKRAFPNINDQFDFDLEQ